MSRQVGSPTNFNRQEIQNAVLQVLGADPASPVQGLMYYSSVSRQPLFYDPTSGTFRLVATDSALLNAQNAAYYLSRANHTGSQTASTISDLASVVKAYRLDEFAAPTAAVSMNSQRLTGLAAPTAGGDAVNKTYADNLVAAISWKDEVKTFTKTGDGNVTLATGAANGSVIAGYTLATGDRFALGDQTAGAENGIYTANATGAPTRATDADTAAEIQGAAFYVTSGTNGGNRYVNNNTGAVTLGTTALTFASFGGGASYTNGNGIALSANVFSFLPKTGGGLAVDGTGAYVDKSIVVTKPAAIPFGDGTAQSFDLTHNLGTRFVTARFFLTASPYTEWDFEVQALSTTQIRVVTGIVPTSNQFTAVIHG